MNEGIFTVHSELETTQPSGIKENNAKVIMELDTGASLTIMSESTLKQKLPKLKLQASTVMLKTYSGEKLKVLGQAQVKLIKVTYKIQEVEALLIVVAGDGPTLFGRSWLQMIQLDWKNIRYMTTALDKLLQKHKILFKEELGTMNDIQVQLRVKPDAIPKFCRTRSAPYALRLVIEQELKRLEKIGAIESMKYGDWATPVVPIPKPDGTVRLCGGFKITVNPAPIH